jgi:type IV pilus assembly protein PilC
MIHLPYVGTCLEKLALARMAWALHLTMNVAMDMRRLVPLALRATQNDYYIRHTDEVVAAVGGGKSLTQALAQTGAFPSDFLDTLAVGEESGQIVEAMDRLADRYEEETESAIRLLAVVAGMAVFLVMAGLMVFLIFRLAGFYFNAIRGAMN